MNIASLSPADRMVLLIGTALLALDLEQPITRGMLLRLQDAALELPGVSPDVRMAARRSAAIVAKAAIAKAGARHG